MVFTKNGKLKGDTLAVKVIIPSRLDDARVMEEQILEAAEQKGFDEGDMFAIKLALEEAFVNAVKHGNQDDATKHVSVSYEVTDDELRVTIADEGTGFDPGGVPDPTDDANLERPCGRGLMLIRAYMDEVEHSPNGNEVRLLKRRSTDDAEDEE